MRTAIVIAAASDIVLLLYIGYANLSAVLV